MPGQCDDNQPDESLKEDRKPVPFPKINDIEIERQSGQQNALDESTDLVEEDPTADNLLKSPVLARSVAVLSAPSIPVRVNEHALDVVSTPKRNVVPKIMFSLHRNLDQLLLKKNHQYELSNNNARLMQWVPQPEPQVVIEKVVTPKSAEKATQLMKLKLPAKEQRNNAIIKRLCYGRGTRSSCMVV